MAFFDVTFSTNLRLRSSANRPDLVVVCEDNFNFLTKMCLSRNRELAFEIAAVARGLGIPSVINGSDATDHAADYLTAGFDHVICRARWRQTLVECVRNCAEPGARYDVPRTATRSRVPRLRSHWTTLPITGVGPGGHAAPYREAWMRPTDTFR